ncbi:MAG: tyrosine-type recombinase/integrase [Muribaculaceae bacterium]|nr:tyrosine-type recombinase/integrase [Muribaculaceae bacterium]
MDILSAFFNYITDELAFSEHTVAAYRNDIEQWRSFVAPQVTDLKDFDPMTVTTNDTRAWVAWLGKQGMSTSSIKRKLSSVRALYRFMIKRHGVKTNPVTAIKINRREKPLPKFIDAGEINNILDTLDNEACNETDYKGVLTDLILNLLYQSGMRASELVALTDDRVDCERGELKVLGKRNKERIIPFAPALGDIISKYLDIRPRPFVAGSPFLLDEEGTPVNYNKVYRIVRGTLDGNVSSPKRSPHVLRHTFATDMLNGGADLTSVRKLLGHESLATTQIYTHVSVAELHDSYNKAHPRARHEDKTKD